MITEAYKVEIEKIKKTFEEEGAVTLFNFLKENEFTKLQKTIRSLQFKQSKNILTHSFSSTEFKLDKEIIAFIERIIEQKISENMTVQQFKHKDYMILHDDIKQTESIDIIFNVSSWSEEFGGQVIYTDGTGDYTQLPVEPSSLTIIRKLTQVNRFVKYVNNKAQNDKRIFLEKSCTVRRERS